MAKPGRWMRLDTRVFDSEWVFMLSPLAQLAWIRLLVHVKSEGLKGTSHALTPAVAARKWGVPVEDVEAMIAAAVADGALDVSDGWTVTNWAEYQECDSSERTRKWREKQGKPQETNVTPKKPKNETSRDVTDRHTSSPLSRTTETETGTDMESANALSARAWFAEDDSPGGALAREIASTKIAGGKTPYAEGERLKYLTRQRCDDLAKRIRTLDPGGDEVEHLTQAWHEYHDGKRTPPYKDAVRALGDWVSQREANWKRLAKARGGGNPRDDVAETLRILDEREAQGASGF